MSKPKVFSLDSFQDSVAEYHLRRERMAGDKRWTDEFKDLVLRMAPEQTSEFQVAGRTVLRLVPGQLNLSKLAKERPDLLERFMRQRVVRDFDQAQFQQEEPELFKQYQAQRLTRVDGSPPVSL